MVEGKASRAWVMAFFSSLAESQPAPSLLYRDIGLVGRILRDELNGDVSEIVVDCPEEYEKVAAYVHDFFSERPPQVELYAGSVPIFEFYGIEKELAAALERKVYDGVLSFAVLHHIPAAEKRALLTRQVAELLKPGGLFILSVWQFQHSPKLMERVQPWELAGINGEDVEEGDTLLDWRHQSDEQSKEPGLRYVHLFSRDELAALARDSGFEIIDEFESDGKGGRLGLYQVWQKKAS